MFKKHHFKRNFCFCEQNFLDFVTKISFLCIIVDFCTYQVPPYQVQPYQVPPYQVEVLQYLVPPYQIPLYIIRYRRIRFWYITPKWDENWKTTWSCQRYGIRVTQNPRYPFINEINKELQVMFSVSKRETWYLKFPGLWPGLSNWFK